MFLPLVAGRRRSEITLARARAPRWPGGEGVVADGEDVGSGGEGSMAAGGKGGRRLPATSCATSVSSDLAPRK
jgi:hypothetical protein